MRNRLGGIEFPEEKFEEYRLSMRAAWRSEVISHEECLLDLHDHLPPEIFMSGTVNMRL